jgi:hypothetical protein
MAGSRHRYLWEVRRSPALVRDNGWARRSAHADADGSSGTSGTSDRPRAAATAWRHLTARLAAAAHHADFRRRFSRRWSSTEAQVPGERRRLRETRVRRQCGFRRAGGIRWRCGSWDRRPTRDESPRRNSPGLVFPGERTSTARSGANGQKPTGSDAGKRSREMNERSGPRTVGGSVESRNPHSISTDPRFSRLTYALSARCILPVVRP